MLSIKSFSKTKKFIVGLLFAAVTFTLISCDLLGEQDEPSNNNSNTTQEMIEVTAPVLTKVEKAAQHLRVTVFGDFGSDAIDFYYNTKNDTSTATKISMSSTPGMSWESKTLNLPDYGTYYIWAKRVANYSNYSDFSNCLQYTLSKPTADLTLEITQTQSAVDYSGQKTCYATIKKNSTDSRNITYQVLYNGNNNISTAKVLYLSENNVGNYKNSFTINYFGDYFFWVKITLQGEENISTLITASILETYKDPIINQAVTFY